MAYGYHRGINECYAGTSSECTQIKEEHELKEHAAFQFHKAVVRHGFRKIRLHRTLNEEQVVVLEIAECAKVEIQQNGHDFTVGQRGCTPSALHSTIVFLQISSLSNFSIIGNIPPKDVGFSDFICIFAMPDEVLFDYYSNTLMSR